MQPKLLLIVCSLTACAAIEPREVPVPISVPCVKVADIPALPKLLPPKPDSDFQQKLAVLNEYVLALELALIKSRARLEGCAAP